MAKGKSPLEVGIIGGGVAGLSAAIALKRAGHKIEVRGVLLLYPDSTDMCAGYAYKPSLTLDPKALRENWLYERIRYHTRNCAECCAST